MRSAIKSGLRIALHEVSLLDDHVLEVFVDTSLVVVFRAVKMHGGETALDFGGSMMLVVETFEEIERLERRAEYRENNGYWSRSDVLRIGAPEPADSRGVKK